LKPGGNVELPLLQELICELHPVTEIFLRDIGSIFDAWYPLKENSFEADAEASKVLFDMKKRALLEELEEKGVDTNPMPLMRSNARRNTAEHPKLGTVGCTYFFGGESRSLDSTSYLSSPLWLGERVRVRWSAKVVGPSLIEGEIFMNTSSVVTRSIICQGSQVDDLAVVKDSIIGRNVYIEPGVKILHRRGIECERIVVKDFRDRTASLIPTGRRKLGAVIGDGCRIGANVVIEPGTVLLPGTRVPPLTHVEAGIYPPEYFENGGILE